MYNKRINVVLAIAIAVVVIAASIPAPVFSQTEEKKTLRIGYFPNINHAQAVIGLGRGDFQKALGDNVEVTTQTFNAGPSAMEALLANQIDVTYVGPGPAINGYVRSGGEALKIISGAASGGAVFTLLKILPIRNLQHLRLATHKI
jgi:NitT/TauT family transport system substrate-binding protein